MAQALTLYGKIVRTERRAQEPRAQEPLARAHEAITTARFCALYGHWYPHARDDAAFCRAVLNQARAVALAMAAVREINPRARLVHTEDAGRIYSTPRLRYQAAFENHRRWLAVDLLCGEVGPRHPLWGWLREAWLGAEAARAEGADVRAVTAWALLGSSNWHCLSTRDEGHYEPGAFDTRGGVPRETPLGALVRELAAGRWPQGDGPGWWRRPERLLYGRPRPAAAEEASLCA